MLAKSRAAFTYALSRNSDGIKTVVNDFRVKKYSEFVDILRAETVIGDSRILVSVCCFPLARFTKL